MAKNKREDDSLREAAEKLIRTGKAKVSPPEAADMESLLHELSVHQVELEAQNENLREAEKQAEDARHHYALLFHEAPVAYFVLDRKGMIEEVNRAGERLIGLPASALRRTPFSRYLSADSLHSFHGHLKASLSTDVRQRAELVVRNWSSHAEVNVLIETVSLPPVLGSDRVRCALMDITHQKTAEKVLQKSQAELQHRVEEGTRELKTASDNLIEETKQKEGLEKQLRQAQKMEALATLAGGIAHDFNNILAATIGFAELIQDHLPEASRERAYADRVIVAGMRGRDLVRQMLTFSRHTEEEKRPLRLSPIVKESMKLLRASTPSTIGIRVDVQTRSDLVLGDPTQVQQVVMNLATNAAYAMREKGGRLDIGLSSFTASADSLPSGIEPGPYLKLTMSDTGTGMPPEIMDKIFDPFFTTKGVGEGTGLGLSVVLGIVKQMRGHIFAESSPGEGSVFTIYFPMVRGKLPSGAVGDESIPTGCERILFVDDEEALVMAAEKLLASLGYEVTSRTSSREALVLFRLDPSRFDLVITDQTMPDMTGIELAKEIVAIRPDMPVILSTGFSHLVGADEAKAAGIRAFTMKPLTKGEIARTVRNVLDG